MRAESLIFRLLRMFLPRALRLALGAGSGRGMGRRASPGREGAGVPKAGQRQKQDPRERAQAKAARQAEKRARQSQRITRRLR